MRNTRCSLKKNAVMLFFVAAALLVAVLAGGTEGDPLVTLSYLREHFVADVTARLNTRTEELKSNTLDRFAQQRAQVLKETEAKLTLESRLTARMTELALAKIKADPSLLSSGALKTVTLQKGDRVVGKPGGAILLKSGAAKVCGAAGTALINVTAGNTRAPGSEVKAGIYYMLAADDGSGVEVTSQTAVVQIKDGSRVLRAYEPKYTAKAEALQKMGLFLGTSAGFELERVPTRQESLIMLIRLLGEEQKALAYEGKSAFTDLKGWADGIRYVKYGEAMNYTSGMTATTFVQQGAAQDITYLTFVLRALGYDDRAGDFSYKTSYTKAMEIGLLTQSEWNEMHQNFRRDHVALLSYNALSCQSKSGGTLGDKLVNAGVLTREQLSAGLAQ